MTPEQQQKYLTELRKVGFDEEQAQRIVAEAAERQQQDPPLEVKPSGKKQEPLPPRKPLQPKERKAVEVIRAKQAGRTTWAGLPVRPTSPRVLPVAGQNAMQAMHDLLTADLKRLSSHKTRSTTYWRSSCIT